MVDISMGGTKVDIHFINGGTLTIDQFSDEGTPIEIPSTQVADGAKNMNGVLVSWSKPSVPTVTLTLIPGSDDDNALRAKLRSYSLSGTHKPVEAYISSLVIHTPTYASYIVGTSNSTASKSVKTFTFYNGRMQSGQPAIGSNAEGKGSPSTYTFMFEGIE